MIHIGDKAPDFVLLDQKGQQQQLSSFRGRPVLLYFYPRDMTPGCTVEACGLREEFPQFETLDAVVIGISMDTVESHRKFAEQYNLPFYLLSDPQGFVIRLYDAWGIKKFIGRTFEGILRISYLIDDNGIIVKKYDRVKPKLHAEEVLIDLKKERKTK